MRKLFAVFRRTIGLRVFLLVLCFLILSTVYLTWTHIRTCRARYQETMYRQADSVAESIQRSTRASMLAHRPEELRETIDVLGEQPGILRIRILNKSGKIVHTSDESERGALIDMSAEQCYACHARDRPIARLERDDRVRFFEDASGHQVLGVISPIHSTPDCSNTVCHSQLPSHPEGQSVLGVLDVNMSLDHLDAGYRESLRTLINHSLVLVPVLTLILGLAVYTLLHKRIRALIRGTQAVAKGDLQTVIDISGKDEIGELATSFNEMTSSLLTARNQQRSWFNELEEKVRTKSAELTRVQEEVFAADKLASIGRLAAGVAHEINNPLGGIQVFSGLLLEELGPDDPAREKIQRIADETARCRKIVQGLLEFARPRAPAIGRLDLNEAIDDCMGLLDGQAVFHNVVVRREKKEPLPRLEGDIDQIRQVVVNIVFNAAEAMGGEGEIIIRTGFSESDRHVELEILDTGPGIEEAHVGQLFEPFFTTKDPGKGTGLGLAVSFGIVSRHGGRIQGGNRPEGGARFLIRLPVDQPEKEQA